MGLLMWLLIVAVVLAGVYALAVYVCAPFLESIMADKVAQ